MTTKKDPLLIDPKQFQKDVSINPVDMDSNLIQQAALFAQYAVKHADAQTLEGRRRLKRDIIKAQVDKKVRDQLASEGGKVTEAIVTSKINQDKDYVNHQLALNEAKANTALGWAALEAFRQRRDMVIQLCVAAREEGKGTARVQEAVAGEGVEGAKRQRALDIMSKAKKESS